MKVLSQPEKIHEIRNLMETEKYESQRRIDEQLETVLGLTIWNDNIGYGTPVYGHNLCNYDGK